MIEIEDQPFLESGCLYFYGIDCLTTMDLKFYREQLFAQMMGWA